ncbi:hypothetical protein ANME2D_02153 [Candidatus Methanoperedens nitroreducens]|uniref:Yip1 domain-containing protein n=1 Tax=Candidatus Methanoperedens nitratireducens TaxID=1392998 RepID=A0A062V4C8_9EURY|nr:YIP1 family protein [Candidatus Methanoperedens nitroreducens]KCZ71423.1 hypothetical protein ANME2D_02153 [Candidatus Methanoperedens nitroreducens]MDJ1421049.1 YIP1 family protein [Candidatus Methanoperedens sp.]
MDLVEKVKGFLMEPTKTFDASKEDTLGEALKYYITLAAIYSAISALLFAFVFTMSGSMMGFGDLGRMFGVGAGIAGAIAIFLMVWIFLIIGIFIIGAIVHIFVYIVGGRKGITQTIKAFMYGQTPVLLFGWIPLIGPIAGIWALVLEVLGIRQLHELTTGRAILAVLLPIIIIMVIIFIAVFAAFMFTIDSTGGMGY